MPMGKPRTAVVVTGSEAGQRQDRDAFGPAVEAKLKEYDVPVMSRQIVSDDMESIIRAIRKAADDGAEMILCTGGMSVDPTTGRRGPSNPWVLRSSHIWGCLEPCSCWHIITQTETEGRHGGACCRNVSPQMEPQGEYRSWGFPAASCIPEDNFDLILPEGAG